VEAEVGLLQLRHQMVFLAVEAVEELFTGEIIFL
jgi:hypothetical protein